MSTESRTPTTPEETTTPNDYAKVPEPKEFKIGYGVYVTLSNKWDPKDPDKKGKIDELNGFIEKNKDDPDKQKLIANIETVIKKVNQAKKILDAAAEKYKIAVENLHKNYKNKEIKSSDDSKVSGFFGLKRKFQKATASREYIKQRTNTPIIMLNTTEGKFKILPDPEAEERAPGQDKVYTFKEAVSIGFDIKHFLVDKSEENAKKLVNQFLSYSSLFKNDKKKKGKAKKEPTPQPEDSEEFTDLIDGVELEDEEIDALRLLLSVSITSESLMESEEQDELLKKLLALADSKKMSDDQKKLIKSAYQKLETKGKIQQLQNLYDKAAPKKEPETTNPETEQGDSEESDTKEIEINLENMEQIFDQNKLSFYFETKKGDQIVEKLSYKIPANKLKGIDNKYELEVSEQTMPKKEPIVYLTLNFPQYQIIRENEKIRVATAGPTNRSRSLKLTKEFVGNFVKNKKIDLEFSLPINKDGREVGKTNCFLVNNETVEQITLAPVLKTTGFDSTKIKELVGLFNKYYGKTKYKNKTVTLDGKTIRQSNPFKSDNSSAIYVSGENEEKIRSLDLTNATKDDVSDFYSKFIADLEIKEPSIDDSGSGSPATQEKITIEQFRKMRQDGKEDFSNLDMSGLDFRKTFEEATLIGINFSNANLEKANLKNVFCSNSNFSEANLSGANLIEANLSGADLSGADLSNADCDSAFITDSNLASANLQGASFIGTVLDSSNLKNAILEGANLTMAILSNADLSGANLKNANFTKARYNDDTKWPKDFKPDKKGAIREQESLQERLERLIKPYLKQRLRNKRRV